MARTPVSNEAFYREVDEELRRDQLTTFWQRRGRALIAGVLLLLALAAVAVGWQRRHQAALGEQAETLSKGLDQLQSGRGTTAAQTVTPLADTRSEGLRVAAALTRAAAALEGGNSKAAVDAYRAIAANEGLAEPYRQLALIRQTAAEYDQLAPAVVIERLEPLAKPGNPWFGSAGEMLAVAYLGQRKPDLAGRVFAQIARDKSVPETLRNRAVQMAGSLGVDMGDVTAPAAAASPAP